MSELTSCNYCDLQSIKREAKKKSEKVYLRRGDSGGIDVYIVPKGEKLNTTKQADGNPSKQWACWFMELTDYCVC